MFLKDWFKKIGARQSYVEIQETKKINLLWFKNCCTACINGRPQSVNIPVTVLKIAQGPFNAILPKAFQTCQRQSRFRYAGLRLVRKLNFEILVVESSYHVTIFVLCFVLVTYRWSALARLTRDELSVHRQSIGNFITYRDNDYVVLMYLVLFGSSQGFTKKKDTKIIFCTWTLSF